MGQTLTLVGQALSVSTQQKGLFVAWIGVSVWSGWKFAWDSTIGHVHEGVRIVLPFCSISPISTIL